MEIHEIIRNEKGITTKDEYRGTTPEEIIKRVVEMSSFGQKIVLDSRSIHGEIISFFKGKEMRDEYFSILFDDEDEIQEKFVNALKNIKAIQFY